MTRTNPPGLDVYQRVELAVLCIHRWGVGAAWLVEHGAAIRHGGEGEPCAAIFDVPDVEAALAANPVEAAVERQRIEALQDRP